MKLAQINRLRQMERDELIAEARRIGVKLDGGITERNFPTADALRIRIIEKTIEAEGAEVEHTLTIRIPAGPAFRANATETLARLIDDCPDGGITDVLQRLLDGVESSTLDPKP